MHFIMEPPVIVRILKLSAQMLTHLLEPPGSLSYTSYKTLEKETRARRLGCFPASVLCLEPNLCVFGQTPGLSDARFPTCALIEVRKGTPAGAVAWTGPSTVALARSKQLRAVPQLQPTVTAVLRKTLLPCLILQRLKKMSEIWILV